jgi:hypothetical protein
MLIGIGKEIIRKMPQGRSEDQDVGRMIGWGGLDLIDLAQDRDQWKVIMNMVMNLRIP